MAKDKFVAEIREGEMVASLFQVRQKQLQSFKHKPGVFLSLSLGDRTGELAARAWENGEHLARLVEVGDVVRVEGEATSFQGKLQLNLRRLTVVTDEDLDIADFLPVTPQDRDALWNEIRAAVQEVTDPHCRALLERFLQSPDFRRAFYRAPAGKRNHQPYIGGLLEHTAGVVRMARAVAAAYPGVNADLLVTGAILHDVGKIQEYTFERSIDYSDAGRLLGHIVLGVEMVSREIEALPAFPPVLKLKILHMLTSHHGYYEWQSPKRPKFLEACILHHLDLLDAEIDKFKRAAASAGDSNWSSWRPELGRFVFTG
jgi:3'-5' exoribonuclease